MEAFQKFLWVNLEKEQSNHSEGNYIKKYIYIYFQGSKGDTDIEKRHVHTVGEGEGGTIWESSTETHTWPQVKCTASGNLL